MSDEEQLKSDAWMGEPAWALERIMTETGRDPVDAERLRRELAGVDVSLQAQVLGWWRGSAIDMDREVHGWSIRRLLRAGHCTHVIATFTWLDGLLRFPEETLQMLSEPRCELIFDEADRAAAIKRKAH